jgi:hypothetical protein
MPPGLSSTSTPARLAWPACCSAAATACVLTRGVWTCSGRRVHPLLLHLQHAPALFLQSLAHSLRAAHPLDDVARHLSLKLKRPAVAVHTHTSCTLLLPAAPSAPAYPLARSLTLTPLRAHSPPRLPTVLPTAYCLRAAPAPLAGLSILPTTQQPPTTRCTHCVYTVIAQLPRAPRRSPRAHIIRRPPQESRWTGLPAARSSAADPGYTTLRAQRNPLRAPSHRYLRAPSLSPTR